MRTLILISLAAHLTLPVNTTPDEINRLDECIQKRFHDRKTFGMERIGTLDFHGIRRFHPENATEQAVVTVLEQKGSQVAVYLAGRNINVAPSLLPDLAPYRFGVQGPAYITHFSGPKVVPGAASLIEESRKALDVFKTADGYEIQKGNWTIALRPLRATNAACIQCHNGSGAQIKIGDPIGVVMYAYH
jgi:hypothetical protein